MKIKLHLIIAIVLSSLSIYSQNDTYTNIEKRSCITIGVLEGGGSLIGVDFETLIGKRFGIQVGAGFIGFGGGLNYHFKPTIRSSFLSLQYLNQGVGENFVQNAIGPSYVFRNKRWFTFQIGVGFIIERGPAYPSSMKKVPAMLTYAIGVYIPTR